MASKKWPNFWAAKESATRSYSADLLSAEPTTTVAGESVGSDAVEGGNTADASTIADIAVAEGPPVDVS
jgi:hypothetical protein